MTSESGEMSALGSHSQEDKAKTLEEFLREEMESTDQIHRRWRSFKDRINIGFKGMGCCGATWRFKAVSAINTASGENVEEAQELQAAVGRQIPAAEESMGQALGMNLAAALAAERQFRANQECVGEGGDAAATSALMRQLEEEERERVESDKVCCVCMGRSKGAALIPCGHTFCRVCSREIWLNRGSCPLCNRLINEILDIY